MSYCVPQDAHYGLDALSKTKYDVIALDSSMDLGRCHTQMTAVGKGVQGNMDPTVLYAPPAKITEIVTNHLQAAFGHMSSLPTAQEVMQSQVERL